MLLTNSGLFFAASNIPAVRELLTAPVSKKKIDMRNLIISMNFSTFFFACAKKKCAFSTRTSVLCKAAVDVRITIFCRWVVPPQPRLVQPRRPHRVFL